MDFLTPVLTSAQMRQCDRETMESEPISSIALMERASRAVYNQLQKEWEKRSSLLFICGPGNNGGDALCIARMALTDGHSATVLLVTGDRSPSPSREFQLQLLQQYRPEVIHMFHLGDSLTIEGIDYIVDGLFGTGLLRKPEGVFQSIIHQVNASGKKTFSIDMPSGLPNNGNFGEDSYVRAQLTIGIQCAKPAYFHPQHCIQFKLVNAGIKTDNADADVHFISPQEPWISKLEKWLPQNPIFGHKGTQGRVLLIGGTQGMSGSIALAARACIENGAGYTHVFTEKGSEPWLAQLPKAMCIAQDLTAASFEAMPTAKIDIIAIGPGLGTHEARKALLESVIQRGGKLLLDADALTILSEDPTLLKRVPKGSIFTPHPGEFQRLFGFTVEDSQFIEKGRALAVGLGIHLLAKNKYSTYFSAEGEVIVSDLGNSSLAQGGSGDRLTGIIAAWWAKTQDAKTAVIAGQFKLTK